MRLRSIPTLAAVLLTAACASTTTSTAPEASTPAAQSPSTVPSQPASAPTSPTATGAGGTGHGSNIVLSTNAKNMPPGPFRITAISCGPYTAAEQSKFGTNAKGGLVYRYTNASNSLTGTPALTVDFTNGTEVLGDNATGGSAPDIGPGQSAEGYVDALDGSGQNLTFTGCELMQYGLRGMAGSSFAP